MISQFLKWVASPFQKKETDFLPSAEPVVLLANKHTFSKKVIRLDALKVLYRLQEAGYQAYLVGGGVRDGLLGRHPKDFDVVTNAHPEQVWHLFRNSRMIGRRFRLVHVHFGGHIVEVATFRAKLTESQSLDSNLQRRQEDGMILRDNIYGTLEQDVWRRDFTVNAIYYNIADSSLIDYVGGIEDLKNKVLRLIGNPILRYREDPVRMLRAIRFAAKLQFSLHPETEKPIFELAGLLKNVPSARLYDEYLKLFLSGFAKSSFLLLRQYGLFKILFPQTEKLYTAGNANTAILFIEKALNNTDERIAAHKSVNPIFLLAVFLWYPMTHQMNEMHLPKKSALQALHEASELIFNEQQRAFAIPRRVLHSVKEIWTLQIRLQKPRGHRAHELFMHPRFRAAYDFLMLRKEAGEPLEPLCAWWTEYIASDPSHREKMASDLPVQKKPQRRKRRKKRGSQEKT